MILDFTLILSHETICLVLMISQMQKKRVHKKKQFRSKKLIYVGSGGQITAVLTVSQPVTALIAASKLLTL